VSPRSPVPTHRTCHTARALSAAQGVDNDPGLDLHWGNTTGKGVAKHTGAVMASLDHLRAPENAIKEAARGILVL
jgi:hypothetical protein